MVKNQAAEMAQVESQGDHGGKLERRRQQM